MDPVTLLEVLEHLTEPQAAAAEAVRAASRAVVATVPSHEDNNPEHIQRFDGAALERMFRAAGGRRCADPGDQARIVEQCQLYRELCRDRGVLDAPRRFASDHTRVVWRESAGRRATHALAFDDTTCEITVMSGLPASGQNHWLAAHRPQLPVVSLDALREAYDVDPADDQSAIVHAARDAAREHLRNRRDFAWNATNLSERLRGAVVGLARRYQARVHVVYCEAAADVIAARNRARTDPVPAAAIAGTIERWSVPTLEEAHAVTHVVSR